MSNKVKVVRTNRRDLGGIDFRKIATKIWDIRVYMFTGANLWFMIHDIEFISDMFFDVDKSVKG